MAENAKFTAGDAHDDLVVDRKYGRRVGFTALRITILDLPDFLAGLGVESDDSGIGLVEEDLAISVCETAVDGVASHNWNNRMILLRLILPENAARLVQVEREHVVGERRVQPHHVTDDDR